MRDIKFRAWDKVNNRMFEGWMLDGSTGDGSWKGGHFGDLEMLYSSVEGFDAEELGREGWDWIDAENVELMQYTGLKDKNGVEIYEGDILEVFENYQSSISDNISPMLKGFYAVRFEAGSFGVYRREGFWDLSMFGFEVMPNYGHIDRVVIISNIHEKPELLK